ncbi:MAG: transcriptional regulator [Planctomyces sp.]
MEHQVRIDAPEDHPLPIEILELQRLIDSCPAPHRAILSAASRNIVKCHRRRLHILNLFQDALSDLRHHIQHLTFDLEATRRERDALHTLLYGEGDNDLAHG